MTTFTLTDDGVDVSGTDSDGRHPFGATGSWTGTVTSGGGAIRVVAFAGDKIVHYTADGHDDFPDWGVSGDGTDVLTIDVDNATLTD